MKNKYIKAGYTQDSKSEGSLDLTKYIKDLLNDNGYAAKDCCGKKALIDLDFTNDVTAAVGGVEVGGLYHTAGVLKIRLT